LSIGIVEDPIFQLHETGEHPERPKRLEAISILLEALGWSESLRRIPCASASPEVLRTVHTDRMIEHVREICGEGGGAIDADTVLCARSWEVALKAVGSSIAAVEATAAGNGMRRSFVICRPPGHHATANRSMGFCLFNNIALAAQRALSLPGIRKVAIVDFDVHHGNGTQDIFYDRSDVFFLSIHQWPHYPGTGLASERGTRDGLGTTLNIPLSGGITLTDWMDGFARGLDAVCSYDPDLVLVSAGFDAHHQDPLGDFPLTEQAYGEIASRLSSLAGDRGMVALLEGGYHLEALARSVVAFIDGMR
jgi:acetoin utilization deacetylase AcuC-like enzyme